MLLIIIIVALLGICCVLSCVSNDKTFRSEQEFLNMENHYKPKDIHSDWYYINGWRYFV